MDNKTATATTGISLRQDLLDLIFLSVDMCTMRSVIFMVDLVNYGHVFVSENFMKDSLMKDIMVWKKVVLKNILSKEV